MKEMDLDKWLSAGKITEAAYLNLTEGAGRKNDAYCEGRELKISVLISTYRRAPLLIRLLDSIRMQNYRNSEIIIVDDASCDETEEVVNRYIKDNPGLNIVFKVNECNAGVSKSKRRAYREADGDIIIFSDDDDYYIDPSYFHILNQVYLQHPDCSMTIASTLTQYVKEGRYELQELNTPYRLSTREYLNGFMGHYIKPGSMFTMSLRNSVLKDIHYEELKCFNDTALYLFGLLGKGSVYTINKAVGVYCIHDDNMTGRVKAGYTTDNLEAKEDVFYRANKAGLLDDPEEWHYRNLAVTARNYLANNMKITEEDRIVWKWMKDHLAGRRYYRFAGGVIKTRVRKGRPISLMWINP